MAVRSCRVRYGTEVLMVGEGWDLSAEIVSRVRRRPRQRLVKARVSGVRFALYGRTSTVDFQDPVSSFRWQRETALEVIAGRGGIVVEFLDTGCSRSVPWERRPEGAALLRAVRDPGRGFDAVVVGEYERAFAGTQFRDVLRACRANGVELWLPEADGPVDLDNPVHEALLLMLGAQSRREVLRARHRTLSAMRAQACLQGRFLGGRPPYGYRLVDAGPHPTVAHARWGRRANRLAPDLATAPWVRWLFRQRVTGRSIASLARELNERGVPCPSGADRARSAHRSGRAWRVRTVVAILENPRYTGRQVWNRQRTERDSPEGRGKVRVQRWNSPDEWAVSTRISHEPLIDKDTFLRVQGMRSARATKDGKVRDYDVISATFI